MRHLYFVRHGQSLVNVGGVFCTQAGTERDTGLTELGREQAVHDGEKAAASGLTFDLILCSPLLRARETAEIIAGQVGYPVSDIQNLDLITEIDFGELEGTQCKLFYDTHTYADLGKFKGAETIEQLQQRAEKALEHVRGLPQANILLVSHSLFGRAIRRVVENKPYTDEFTHGTSLPHGEIIQLV